MKKIILGISLFSLALLAIVLYSAHAFAEDKGITNDNNNENKNSSFNANQQLTQSKCNVSGDPIINVTQKVQNDADSGFAGNYWAFDYYNRHIKVWQTIAPVRGSGTYCAIVTYSGHFYSVPGQIGPGNSPVGAKINTSTDSPVNGGFSGGRRATITGSLLATPLWPTNGSVGTTNYKCDINGVCPGVISWPGQYFNSGYVYNDAWWGWKYSGGSHGTWINECANNATDTVPGNNPACLGSSGNIL